ncbi:hypothetical protein AXE80_08100 [Wenyingzhuangia fucanilytica]|uniref:Uncharacterized protein n=1 Tax=Wenyingzhuangia fucanilytica TaxID=1790137 RepID=A0A1B1Y638_9FLAO|nr:PQQ-binding-like beta-propeller repeat protein [Wenyingzhuangia fucanilytica]ANW96242.1 hypothetical protein AXE80_08100 [Wenyingzhuangia fucanilytica]
MYKYQYHFLLVVLITFFNTTECVSKNLTNPHVLQASAKEKSSLYSIDTKLTIRTVRTAKNKEESYIVGSSYEGTVVGVSYTGKVLWENKLSGFVNHDVWCGDLDGDDKDEIVVANANGTIYCLNNKGELLWEFKKNEAPMYAVTIVHNSNGAYVVAGGFDKNLYYLSPKGALVKEIKTATFSIEKPWSKYKKELPKAHESVANFIRPLKQADGTETLVLLASNNHMNVPGTMYFFKVLEDLPYQKTPIKATPELKKKIRIRPIGDFKTFDVDGDGNEEIILGSSAHSNDMLVSTYDAQTNTFNFHEINKVRFGYDIAQTVLLKHKKDNLYLTRIGNQMRIYNATEENAKEEIIQSQYAYNDVWQDPTTGKVILASAQSGGSCIHVLDVADTQWKKEYKNLSPKGKISEILANTKTTREDLNKFEKSKEDYNSQPVYFMTESVPDNLVGLKNELVDTYKNPVFLNSMFMKNVEKFDRSILSNAKYKKTRDRRKKYTMSHQEAVDHITKGFDGAPGVAYWAGHGNDPYMFSIETTKQVIDNAKGKKTVLIYPEVEEHSKENLNFLLNNLIYPLAKYSQGKNANVFLRSKNIFWLGSNYLDSWSRLMSGEFADVFVPSMEETTDKSMELSLAGRMGMWTSGAVNSWGTRAVPDNVSYDRARQLGYQRLPNHALRMLIFHTANGAQFINNFAVDQDYMSIYWELIAKGALYVPKRNELLSISPVHISMKSPDEHFLNDGTNVKWTTFYDEAFEKNNPFVFSRLNGTWPGASVTAWDFSRYAAGVKERRLNFLAPYENGLVLITPPQHGVFAAKNVVRGSLEKYMHPIYKNILKEYITDGRNYYSTDGKQTYKADEYYKVIEADLKESAKKLPITVSGDVAWVVAQTAPNHLRITIIDNGYINPQKSKALVKFNTISPVKVKDILNKEEFKVLKNETEIEIPLGGFRFIDVELKESLKK